MNGTDNITYPWPLPDINFSLVFAESDIARSRPRPTTHILPSQVDNTYPLAHRDYAALAAVEAGRCELLSGSEPDLLVDGLWFCDQRRIHVLVAAGLLAPAAPKPPGTRVLAILTDAGREVLARWARADRTRRVA